MSLSPSKLTFTALLLGSLVLQATAQQRTERAVSSRANNAVTLGSIRPITPTGSNHFSSLPAMNYSLDSFPGLKLAGMNNLASDPSLSVLLDPQGPLNPATFDPSNPMHAAARELANSLISAAQEPDSLHLDATLRSIDADLAQDTEAKLHNRVTEIGRNPELLRRLQATLQNLNSRDLSGETPTLNQVFDNETAVSDRLVTAPNGYLPAGGSVRPIGLLPANVLAHQTHALPMGELAGITLRVENAAQAFQMLRQESANTPAFHGMVQTLSYHYAVVNPALTLHVDPRQPPQLLKLLSPGDSWQSPDHAYTLTLMDSKRQFPILIVSAPRNTPVHKLGEIIKETISPSVLPDTFSDSVRSIPAKTARVRSHHRAPARKSHSIVARNRRNSRVSASHEPVFVP